MPEPQPYIFHLATTSTDLLTLLLPEQKNTRPKRKVGHAAVVRPIASPFKRALEESQKTKGAKKQKKDNKDKHKKKVPKADKKLTEEKAKLKKKKKGAVKGKKKTETNSKVQDVEQDCHCLYCQELYSESVDAWICCRVCYQWAHELCAGKEGDLNDFVCEFCIE